MPNLTRIISVLFTISVISVLLFSWYQNRGLVEEKERERKQPYQIVKIGDKDDYYELTIPSELWPSKNPDGRSISFNDILYPEMKRWVGERREGVDRSKIKLWVTYHAGESARFNSQYFRLQNIKEMFVQTKPTDELSKKLIQKYPDIKVYANKTSRGVSDYVFTDKNGFVVISSPRYVDTCRIHASYKGKFEIEFYLPSVFFHEMPNVINSVIDLVSTFNPKHYANQNLSPEADEEVEKISEESLKKNQVKISKTKS